MNATKERYGADDLEALFEGASKVIAMKGKKVTEVRFARNDDAVAEVQAVALGPTGNLRAPTIRAGKTWLVGFNEDVYRDSL